MDVKQLKQEFLKCASDPIHFICTHIKVVHPILGLTNFSLYPFQKRILSEYQNNRFNILRKFRQAGCTTLTSAYALWLSIFHQHKTIAILSIGDTESTEVLEKIKIMYDELPEFLKPGVIERNKHTLKLKTRSIIKSRPSGKTSGRSIAGSLLIIDEGAFIENIDEIWASAYPILSTGGKAIVLSTVNGVGNWYHTLYQGALDKTNKFNAIDINWKEHPEYSYHPEYEWLYKIKKEKGLTSVQDWQETTRSNMPYKKWLQEFECEFLGTGDTYVEGSILKNIYEFVSRANNNFTRKYQNKMYVWEEPLPQYNYMISIDTGLGREYDYSAFHIIKLETGEQVAEFYSNKTPLNEFASILVNEGQLYNLAYLVPERNTIGNNLIEWLFDIYEYENVWMDPDDGKFGIQITQQKRESILAKMEEYIRTNIFKINSKRTVDELLTFIIDDRNRAVADEGSHDDLVMSLALGSYAMEKIISTTPLEVSEGIKKDYKPLMPSPSKMQMNSYGGLTEEDVSWILGKNSTKNN